MTKNKPGWGDVLVHNGWQYVAIRFMMTQFINAYMWHYALMGFNTNLWFTGNMLEMSGQNVLEAIDFAIDLYYIFTQWLPSYTCTLFL